MPATLAASAGTLPVTRLGCMPTSTTSPRATIFGPLALMISARVGLRAAQLQGLAGGQVGVHQARVRPGAARCASLVRVTGRS